MSIIFIKGHFDITKYLISDCNCNPQCSTNCGNTPLHCGCQNGHLEVAKYFITEHKYSPEQGNVNGYTPLHSAVSNGHLAVVKYLISDRGCNPQIATNNGLTIHCTMQTESIQSTRCILILYACKVEFVRNFYIIVSNASILSNRLVS